MVPGRVSVRQIFLRRVYIHPFEFCLWGIGPGCPRTA
ncbi:hypothetical protein HCTV-16_gp139 [Haloarcula virus HCTV-16]|nr:hypothetical protein HCTV-16_gp139 [Haloarcula virus HCTV-16]